MKVVFVGPSLPDADEIAGSDMDIRQPACQGDVMQAVKDGATSIGLIDGQFEFVAPVWHKELLFALSQGISVFGAASMGALRAAECADFGMCGVGKIFDDYMSGRRIDDADVALIHSPRELGYIAITVPMVNVDATLEQAVANDLLPHTVADHLSKVAGTIFFKDRSWKMIAEKGGMEWPVLRDIVKSAGFDQKRADAIELIETMKDTPTESIPTCGWQFNATPLWRRLYS